MPRPPKYTHEIFLKLQEYIQSECSIPLTEEEENIYNVMFAAVGTNRKYGKIPTVSFIEKTTGFARYIARSMYYDALNLFYVDDRVEKSTYRNMMFDELMAMARVVKSQVKCAKDAEVFGRLMAQAAAIKGLDQTDEDKKDTEVARKQIKVYSIRPETVGLPSINRSELFAQIEELDIPANEKSRIRKEAMIDKIDVMSMIDEQEEKISD